MSTITTSASDLQELIGEELNTVAEVRKASEDLKSQYKKLSAKKADNILRDYIVSAGLDIASDEDGVLNSFDTDNVYGYVVAKEGRNLGTIRVFKEAGNVVYSSNGSKRTTQLGTITAEGVKKIKVQS